MQGNATNNTATTTARSYNRPAVEAQRLGWSLRKLFYEVANRTIPVYRVGRATMFDPAEVDEALRRNFRIPAAGEPRPPKRRAGRIAQPATN